MKIKLNFKKAVLPLILAISFLPRIYHLQDANLFTYLGALLGTLAVFLVYCCGRSFFDEQNQKLTFANICAFVVALNPWHIYISRGSWQISILLCLLLVLLYVFLNRRSKTKNLVRFSILYPLAVFIGLKIIFLERLFDFEYTPVFLREMFSSWLSYFSGRYLFFEGDWSHTNLYAPYHGVLLLPDVVLLLTGTFFLVKRVTKHKAFLILMMLLVSTIPGLFYEQSVNLLFSFSLLIPLTLISSFGLFYLHKKFNSIFAMIFMLLVYFFAFFYWWDLYFVHRLT